MLDPMDAGPALADPVYQAAATTVDPNRVDELFLYRDDDGNPSYYPGQRDVICEIIQAFLDGKSTVIADAPTGCHAKGQGILMYDGNIEAVENIQVGDRLMGPDSRPRTVLQLCRGRAPLFKITSTKGNSFIINGEHVLSLVRTNDGWGKAGQITDVSLNDYVGWSKTQKHIHKLFRVPVNFQSDAKLPVDPYFMGLLLGDGSMLRGVNICNPEPEIEAEIYQQAEVWNMNVRREASGGRCPSYYMVTPRGQDNPLMNMLRELGVFGHRAEDKSILHAYKTASRSNRLDLLAGLLDTDGSLDNNSYDFISKSPRLALDVAYLARSLGMAVRSTWCEKSCQNGGGGTYYRVSISGDTAMIPCRVKRKQAHARQQVKDVLRTGFSVSPEQEAGDYYGFLLDGDHRYLLGDFTVTHNSGKSVVAHTVMRYLGQGAWGATPKNVLVDQYESIGWRAIRGLGSYSCSTHRGHNCQKGTLLARAEGQIDTKESGCSPYCPARIAASEYFANDFEGGCMTNMHYLWYNLRKHEKANEKRQRQLAVFDEAHMLEAALADMVSIVIKKEDLESIGFTERCADENDIDRWLDELNDHMEGTIDELYATVGDLKRKHGRSHPSVRLHLARLESVQRKQASVDSYLQFRNATRWIRNLKLDMFGNLEYLKVEPVYGGFLVEKCLRIAPHSLMMSATFLSKSMSCVEMHLDPAKVAYVQIPSYFPPENQPIYFDQSICLNKNNLELNLPQIVAKIDRILDYEQGKRGIIHSHSHSITKKIAELSRHKRRFSVVEDGQKQLDAIQKHIDSKDSVLLGPGFVEGVDLKGDLGAFVIFPKVPYVPMLGDKKLMIRESDHPGYCDLLTVRSIIQGAGRVVRGASELANGYFLDGSLNRLLRNPRSLSYFPKSFLAKIRIATI